METERTPLTKEKKKEEKDTAPIQTVSYFSLFRYTTSEEKFYLFLAFLLSCGHGAMMPVFSIIFGNVTSDFTADKSVDQRRKQAGDTALKMFFVGIGTLAAAGLAVFFWNYVGQKLNIRVRNMYFKAVTSQELGWFDVENAEKMTTRYIENVHKFQGAVGQKNHVFIYSLSMTIAGFLIGFISGWWYALIVTMSFPIIMVGMLAFIIIMSKESAITKKNYEDAGGASEQCFGAIKTVKILNGEEHELNIYYSSIEAAKKASEC